jgi:hypothetical protein
MAFFTVTTAKTSNLQRIPPFQVCFIVLERTLPDFHIEIGCHAQLNEIIVSISGTIFGYLNS